MAFHHLPECPLSQQIINYVGTLLSKYIITDFSGNLLAYPAILILGQSSYYHNHHYLHLLFI